MSNMSVAVPTSDDGNTLLSNALLSSEYFSPVMSNLTYYSFQTSSQIIVAYLSHRALLCINPFPSQKHVNVFLPVFLGMTSRMC